LHGATCYDQAIIKLAKSLPFLFEVELGLEEDRMKTCDWQLSGCGSK
jgi:hypothetical protein